MQAHDRARKMCALLKLTSEGCSPSFLLSRRSKHPGSSPNRSLFLGSPCASFDPDVLILVLEALGATSCKNLPRYPAWCVYTYIYIFLQVSSFSVCKINFQSVN